MKKNIFGLTVIALLATIMIINILQDTRKPKGVDFEQGKSVAQTATDETISEGLSPGEIPPDFELQTLDGQTIRLSDYKGKKVILNFWATWCPPCRAEMPYLENYYKTKAKKQNVEIIAVNLTNAETSRNKLETVKDFADEYGLTFPIPLDETGKVGNTYQTITIPTSYMIDSKGIIHEKIIGPMDEEMIKKLVNEMS
ncbi:redoxin domain-containing protein [Siminovitchia sp. 179-K 8D1 HS]|uniref:redoxin domain-containing protein n=1 Tax=Siminovitchia sp. 179-K 8D1 HS TaxID=3142385 RepID=UPI0039A16192